MKSVTLEGLHKEMHELKQDVEKILHFLEEDYELSKETQKELEEARKTTETEYLSQEAVKKRFSVK